MANENELETVKPTKVMLKICGKEREIKFGFSAWAKLEKEYGGLNNIDELMNAIGEKPFQTIPHLLYIGLVDKEGVDEETILDEYGMEELETVVEAFNKALFDSLPKKTKKAEKEAN